MTLHWNPTPSLRSPTISIDPDREKMVVLRSGPRRRACLCPVVVHVPLKVRHSPAGWATSGPFAGPPHANATNASRARGKTRQTPAVATTGSGLFPMILFLHPPDVGSRCFTGSPDLPPNLSDIFQASRL